MKLGTLKSSKPDGELVVVSKDNRLAVKVPLIAHSFREAIENWREVGPKLKKVYEDLSAGSMGAAFPVDTKDFHSPLPRSFQWIDGSAYIQHIVLVRKARNAQPPETLKTVPLMYQGGSDHFLAPHEDIPFLQEDFGLDFEAEIGVILDRVPMGTKAKDAHKYILFFVLINDVTLRGLVPGELAQGFGFFQSKPASSFAPFALTPDELGNSYKEGRLHLPLLSEYNGQFFGNPDAGVMHFSFYDLIEHAARTRHLSAGTILGSGTVSNEDESRGSSCLAEKRMIEQIKFGQIKTPFMKPGDTIKIEMLDQEKHNLFGTIFQKVTPYKC